VCLIGDAAHATSPHAGQGASLALEDAIVLARCLRDIPELGRAFTTFEAERRPRVEKLAREARRQGGRKAAGNSLSRHLRDLMLPFFLKQGVRSLRKVYDYRVDWHERAAWARSSGFNDRGVQRAVRSDEPHAGIVGTAVRGERVSGGREAAGCIRRAGDAIRRSAYSNLVWSSSFRGTLWQCRHRAS
jgi:hypothetical protein